MLVKHLADYSAAIPILCDGKLYAEALYMARVHAEHLTGKYWENFCFHRNFTRFNQYIDTNKCVYNFS